MKKELLYPSVVLCVLFPFCKDNDNLPSKALIDALDLKRGTIISCGNSNMQFGVATRDISCSKESKEDFNLALSLLHSFEYEDKKQLDYLKSMHEVHPANFKVAYAFAAIPCRWVLENKLWKEAATLEVPSANFSWQNYPWQEAMIQFTRLLGSVHTNSLPAAEAALKELNRIHDTLLHQKDTYKANQVAIQISAARGWISLQKGNASEALSLMQ